MTSLFEKALFAEQQRTYSPVFASTALRIAPPSTTNAFMGFVNNTRLFWKNFFTHTIPDMFKGPLNPMKLLLRVIIGFVLIMLVVYLVNVIKKISDPKVSEGFVTNKTDIRSALNRVQLRVNQLSNAEGFQTVSQPIKNVLFNIQPLTVKQASFLGPLQNGAFDADKGISQQLNLGIRSFFFQIDYLTKQTDTVNQPKAYQPVLIYRDNSGNLTSLKSYASLDDTFKYLSEYAFNDRIPNHNDPVIIYLHFVRTPDKYNETENYVKFIKSVSTSLNIMNNYLAKEYYRANKELEIFNQDIHTFDKKILVGTNIDTSYFRNMSDKNAILLSEDLDFKINFHYYRETEDSIDATQIIPTNLSNVNAIIVKANTLLNMNEQQRNDWITTHKGKFILLKDEPNNFLNPAQVSILLNTFGVNVVPYDYFNSKLDDAKAVKKIYGGSWKLKPDILIG